MFVVHGTRKFLNRADATAAAPSESSTTKLGAWYATVLFWKPQVALFVNERTFLPVFVPLAPATEMGDRFPVELRRVLDAHGLDRRFVDGEIGSMGVGRFAKTVSRSVLGVMNEFAFLGRVHRERRGEDTDLVALSVRLSETPTGPLYKRDVSPDRELQALVARTMGD